MPLDLKTLPRDSETLRKIVVDLANQLDRESTEKNKYRDMLRELLDAERARKSEQLSKEQAELFGVAWREQNPEEESAEDDGIDFDGTAPGGGADKTRKRAVRRPLAKHLMRERMVHDLSEAEKHCACCGKDLRLIAEESSERYEYIPASLKVIEDVSLRYACDCTVKTAEKPAQPIAKSTAGASLLAQVIVAKWADHQPLHRQEKMFARHGVEISRKTMGGWMAQCAGLLEPLWMAAKKELFSSHVIGTDDTSVKVLDRKLEFARIGRIWPYVGDGRHPVVVYDYTPTRARAGPARFLEGYRGHLQADAYSVYDAFFKAGRGLTADERLALRKKFSARVMKRLHEYVLRLKGEVLPKSPSGAAVRYALNQWEALTRFLEDGELEIDNGETERANRDIAVGRNNWTFFGSDEGGRTAAVLRTFIASCKRSGVEPFAWFSDVLSRVGEQPMQRLRELLPHHWKAMRAEPV